MFGSAKNTTKSPANTLSERLTGLERAKLERTENPSGATVDEVLTKRSAGHVPAEISPQKRGAQMADKPRSEPEDYSAHLYIGAGIRLKGEITGCDMMRVEGVFEGSAQSRQLLLCPGGSFIGLAQIDEAEVEGSFDGTLHVRGRLFLRNKGLIKGDFSYGQLEIERGGQIDGQISPFDKPRTDKPAEVAKPAEAAKPAAKPAGAKLEPAALPPFKPVAPTAPPRPAAGGTPTPPLNGTQPVRAAAE